MSMTIMMMMVMMMMMMMMIVADLNSREKFDINQFAEQKKIAR